MKTAIIALLFYYSLLCINNPSKAQESANNFNLDFEKNLNKNELPDGWVIWGTNDYSHKKDTSITFAGNYCIVIGSTHRILANSVGCIAYQLPANYDATSISLTGYIKTENVEEGFAGLLLRVDGINGALAFDNMRKRNIHGTNDWTKYRVTLPYFPKEADKIFVAGILTGTGTAWFDKFELFFNGKEISEAVQITKESAKAELDTEFNSGSNIQIENLSEWQIENLFKVGKVWGFLKYYHPQIAKGNINWDYELIRILPEVINNKNENVINGILKNRIDQLGEFSEEKKSSEFRHLKLEADIKWIKDVNFLGEELSSILAHVKDSKKTDEPYYIGLAEGLSGTPIFKNENPYLNMSYSDDGIKLVGLFRYWNIIKYYFPYRNLIEGDWDNVLKSFIPKFILADDELSYKLTLLQLIGKVQDTHANILQRDEVLENYWGLKVPPIGVDILNNQVVVSKIFDQLNDSSGINMGDIITEVNNVPAKKLISEKLKYCPASNIPTKYRDVSQKLLRTNDVLILLTIKNNDSTFNEIVDCVNYDQINYWEDNTSSFKILNDNIGYIYPGSLQKGEIDKIMPILASTRGLIIDLRSYPSDFIVFSLGKYLMPEPTEFVKFTKGSISHPGEFIFQRILKVGETKVDYYKNKIVILVNEYTQSQAEYTAMALRVASNAIVLGSTTAGADGNTSTITLPGNVRTKITGIGVYYPDGSETQRTGIVPDIEIKPTIKGIRNGEDELLNKAIELINNK